MMPHMNVTIYILTHNTASMVLSNLASLKEIGQELIVVDNASVDDTASKVMSQYNGVSVLEFSRNLGFGAALNKAVEMSKPTSPYLLFLNSDALISKEALETLCNYMDKNPSCGMVGGQLINDDHTKQHSMSVFPTLFSEWFGRRLCSFFWPKQFPHLIRQSSFHWFAKKPLSHPKSFPEMPILFENSTLYFAAG